MMLEHKIAKAEHEILNLIAQRWSPRSFLDKNVEREKLMSVLEAARWTPSAYNEQPWRFIVGDKLKSPEQYQKIFDCLNEWNQAWAKSAPVLMMVCGVEFLERNRKPNPTYAYDTGQAAAILTVQANSLGLFVHQMGGFYQDKVITTFGLPEGIKPIAGLALGYLGNPDVLDEEYQKSELASRNRRPLSKTAFEGVWGESL